MKLFSIFIFSIILSLNAANADDLFEVQSIHYNKKQTSDGNGIYKAVERIDQNNHKVSDPVFVPSLRVDITVNDQVQTKSSFARAYFYDQNKQLIATVGAPAIANQEGGHKYDWLAILPKGSRQTIYFSPPDEVLKQENWAVVIVFGDKIGVDAKLYPLSGQVTDYEFPEKNILEDKSGMPIERKPVMDPLIEWVVPTKDPKHPQISMFLRPPLGMTDVSQAKGVLCVCILADSVDGVKRQLQAYDPKAGVGEVRKDQEIQGFSGDVMAALKFAEDHQLLIVGWGAQKLWDPKRNWDNLDAKTTAIEDQQFDLAATAWENGIQHFVQQYNIPKSEYLLWGVSAAAQYACRLAIRKPDYFLAAYVHIPSSYDKPTPDGSRILWCLTTGEMEAGHANSLKFYSECHAMGYPIVYKAIQGVGHWGDQRSTALGFKFLEYALSVRDQRIAYDSNFANQSSRTHVLQDATGQPIPWLDTFSKPPYMGDIANQEMFPVDQASMIPTGFQTPLPTKEIADLWNK